MRSFNLREACSLVGCVLMSSSSSSSFAFVVALSSPSLLSFNSSFIEWPAFDSLRISASLASRFPLTEWGCARTGNRSSRGGRCPGSRSRSRRGCSLSRPDLGCSAWSTLSVSGPLRLLNDMLLGEPPPMRYALLGFFSPIRMQSQSHSAVTARTSHSRA